MRKLDKLKNIEEANKKLLAESFHDKDGKPIGVNHKHKPVVNLKEFDADSYQETDDEGYNTLNNYLNTLNLSEGEKNTILNLAQSWADDMWREGAQGGFAPR